MAQIGKKLTVVAGWYSRSAHQKITEAGGTAQNLKGEAFEFPKPKKKFIPRDAQEVKVAAEAAAPLRGRSAQARRSRGARADSVPEGKQPIRRLRLRIFDLRRAKPQAACCVNRVRSVTSSRR